MPYEIDINKLPQTGKRHPRYAHVLERFLSKVTITDGCWNWNACKIPSGYGIMYFTNKVIKAHRISYCLYIGDLQTDKIIMHTCDNPSCVSPFHLKLGTMKDNNDDMHLKGRWNRPDYSKNHRIKLSSGQVVEIFFSDEKDLDLSIKYDIGIRTIQNIRLARSWKHITKKLKRK